MTNFFCQRILRAKLAELLESLSGHESFASNRELMAKICSELRSEEPLSDDFSSMMSQLGFEPDVLCVFREEGPYVVVNLDERGRRK